MEIIFALLKDIFLIKHNESAQLESVIYVYSQCWLTRKVVSTGVAIAIIGGVMYVKDMSCDQGVKKRANLPQTSWVCAFEHDSLHCAMFLSQRNLCLAFVNIYVTLTSNLHDDWQTSIKDDKLLNLGSFTLLFYRSW